MPCTPPASATTRSTCRSRKPSPAPATTPRRDASRSLSTDLGRRRRRGAGHGAIGTAAAVCDGIGRRTDDRSRRRQHRLGLAASATASERRLCARPRRRGRNGPSVPGCGRRRPRGARRRHPALPVSVHGARLEATRPAAPGARDRARRGRRRRAGSSRSRPLRRRQVVRRQDELASPGRGAAARRRRAGLPRLSAPSGQAAGERARRASRRGGRARCFSCRERATSWPTSRS